MNLTTQVYSEQVKRWPRQGRHILAQFDEASIVVYQAYCRSIGEFAATHGYFGDGFGLGRMSWIKPNFLWMMYRSGWGGKPGQEITLAIRIPRTAFDLILVKAVYSAYVPEVYTSPDTWRAAVASSCVRLQWDPDHGPAGNPLDRRAIQLGLRGEVLARYAREWCLEIQDISGFVQEQREHASSKRYEHLTTPLEHVYPVRNQSVAQKLRLDTESQGA